MRTLALVDGEHYPPVTRWGIDVARERGYDVVAALLVGGIEKLAAGEKPDLGVPIRTAGDDRIAAVAVAIDDLAPDVVLDLSDEPILGYRERMAVAAVVLARGVPYVGPDFRLDPPERVAPPPGTPTLAVFGTGKRTGKTAVGGHLAALLKARGAEPVVVSMGRGGPAEPQLAGADTSLADLRAIAADGRHAASDYLEDAAIAGVATLGCRRVGGGLVGEPFESNVAEGAALAALLGPDTLLFEGSGACIPPVEVDRTLCVVGAGADALYGLASYHLRRSELALAMGGDRDMAAAIGERFCPALACELVSEPVEPPPADARVALFSTSTAEVPGADPVVASSALARRGELESDLARAAAERCDVYLVELKAAAIDTVAVRAEQEGARVVFLRNRPVALDADLDAELLAFHDHA